MDNHQRINQSSGATSYGTPGAIVDAAREVMGGIELDPASAEWANRRVGAVRYFTVEDDGLSLGWQARTVWLNHPFSAGEEACQVDRSKCKKKICSERGYHIDHRIPDNADWIERLVGDYKIGCFEQACCITYACTSEAWFKPLQAYPQCYLSPRTNYYLPDGTLTKGVPKGSVVTYLGPNVGRFYRVMERVYQLGKVQFPASMFDNLIGN